MVVREADKAKPSGGSPTAFCSNQPSTVD